MKKLKILSLCLAFLMLFVACDNKKPAVDTPSNDQNNSISDNSDANDTNNVSLPDENQQVNPSDAHLTFDDAMSLVLEKIDDNIYTVSVQSKKSEIGENNYFIFEINDKITNFNDFIAVSDVSGDLFAYNNEKNEVLPYSKFPLYNASVDAICDWDGKYTSQENGLSIEFMQADSNSFEFYITGEKELSGIGRIRGNTAHFEENNIVIDFICTDKQTFILSGSEEFTGEYK